MTNRLGAALLWAALAMTAGCASLPPGATRDARDPFERFNRASFRSNMAMDRAVVRPVARGYVRITPAPLRRGIGNFFSNIRYPVTIVNQALQGKIGLAGRDTARLLVNTVLGAGFFDPARRMGLEKHDEDFGQTLGRWGVRPGPYLMLPFLGPSDVRDGIGLVPDEYANPRHYIKDRQVRYGLIAVDLLETRAGLLATDATLDKAFDPYAFVRNAWLQRREFLVRDGQVEDEAVEEFPVDDTDNSGGGVTPPATQPPKPPAAQPPTPPTAQPPTPPAVSPPR